MTERPQPQQEIVVHKSGTLAPVNVYCVSVDAARWAKAELAHFGNIVVEEMNAQKTHFTIVARIHPNYDADEVREWLERGYGADQE